MPVYNELATVEQAVAELLDADLGVDTEVILVDDGSTDGTSELIAKADWPDKVTVLSHDVNQGKGAAVRTALGHAKGEFSAIFDADLEYDPEDLAALLAAARPRAAATRCSGCAPSTATPATRSSTCWATRA